MSEPAAATPRHILLIFGTRPEAIKMCPLVKELRARPAARVTVCVTGQHREMLASVLDAFGVVPDVNLDIMRDGQSLYDITCAVLNGVRDTLRAARPDIALVHGDTTTTFAAALACFYERVPVGHVEAGLRTGDLGAPFPEEFNRQAVGIVARWHFAPTERARQNLLREGKAPETIFVTGNTAIDALRTTVQADFRHPILDWAAGSRLILLTAHRRESLGAPMRGAFRAIRRALDETPDARLVYPVHMNPLVREAARDCFDGCDRVRLIEPMDVVSFHSLLHRCFLVLTDSGGIQEEAPALRKPVLVLRDTTERPEGVAAGTLRLTGTEETAVYDALRDLLDHPAAYAAMCRAANPYGDGHASERIADALLGSAAPR